MVARIYNLRPSDTVEDEGNLVIAKVENVENVEMVNKVEEVSNTKAIVMARLFKLGPPDTVEEEANINIVNTENVNNVEVEICKASKLKVALKEANDGTTDDKIEEGDIEEERVREGTCGVCGNKTRTGINMGSHMKEVHEKRAVVNVKGESSVVSLEVKLVEKDDIEARDLNNKADDSVTVE